MEKNQFFMRKLVFVFLFLFGFVVSNGQSRSANSSSYRTALGVKFYPAGITLKHFFNGKNAGELIGYFWGHGVRFTGLYEIHGDFSGAPGLKWYVGPGAHIGFWDHNHRHWHDDHWHGESHASFGVDGVLGLDYKFRGAPINMSLDWQPSFEFGEWQGFVGSWGGLAIRYTF